MIIKHTTKKEIINFLSKFILFIRYPIFAISFVAILFCFIPLLFNFDNKLNGLSKILNQQSNIVIEKAEKINYKFFPQPRLEITNAIISIDNSQKFNVKEKIIFNINILGAYNFKDLRIKKIIFEKVTFKVKYKEVKKIFNFIFSHQNIVFKNSDIDIIKSKTEIINVRNLNYKNLTKKKIKFDFNLANIKILGTFNKKNKNNVLDIKLKNLGINAKILFNKNEKLFNPSGVANLKFLRNRIKLNFDLKENLKIKDSVFRNDNFLINFTGEVEFFPFFKFEILSSFKKMNINNIKLSKIIFFLEDFKINKKLNGDFVLNYNNESFYKNNFIRNILFKLKFQNGNLFLEDSKLELKKRNIFLNLELIDKVDHKKLFFDIRPDLKNSKNKQGSFSTIIGYYNLNTKKIYFKKILNSKNKELSKKKLKELKKIFEQKTKSFDYFNLGDLLILVDEL